jgi:hypothetical protein
MDKPPAVQVEASMTVSPKISSSPTVKPKRVRRPKETRTKPFSTLMRQRLSLLGHPVTGEDPSNTNMNLLIDKLSTELHGYHLEAKHWQEKYLQLQAVVNPSLSLVMVPPPNFKSTAGRFVSGQTFEAVLCSISSMSTVWIRPTTSPDPWANIVSVKPDFSPARARQIWDDLFAPIFANPSRLIFDASPSCRRQSDIDPEDPDMDHMERKLTKMSDLELIDLLHYCSMLISGMHRVVFENPEMASARDHLGKNLERLLREVIFSRDISSNPILVQCLLDGLLGTLGHFATHDRPMAVMSVLELAWQINEKHDTIIHPVTKGMLTYLSTVLASSPSRRAVWMARNQENLQSTSENFFHLISTALLTSSYHSLMTNDEDSLLHYLAQLEEMLRPSDELGTPMGTYSDFAAFSIFHPLPPSADSQGHFTAGPWFKRPPRFWEYDLSSTSPSLPQQDSTVVKDLPSSPTVSQLDQPLSENSTEQLSNSSSSTSSYDTYIPPEELKTLLRAMVCLLRAEASLFYSDYDTCRHWVDEAEKAVKLIPVMVSVQREEILLMRVLCKRTCTFSSGTRTVIQEIERRMIQHDRELLEADLAASNQ